MVKVCIDASDVHGTGTGLLTEGKEYTCMYEPGGYYTILCDNGKWLTKLKTRFGPVIGNKG